MKPEWFLPSNAVFWPCYTTGLWARCLLLMLKAKRIGHLETEDGEPITLATLADILQEPLADIQAGMTRLIASGLLSTDQGGTLFFGPMVKAASTQAARRAAGLRGGNPALRRKFALVQTEKGVIQVKIPTIDECAAFGATIGMTADDCAEFWHYHDARGWVMGRIKAPMKRWKSAMHTWKHAPWKRGPGGASGVDMRGNQMSEAAMRAVQRGRAVKEIVHEGGIVEEV